jgi:hypothetical protein
MMRFNSCLMILALVALAGFLSCSDESGTATMEGPALTSITPQTAGMGDTIHITGANFNSEPTLNRIVVSPTNYAEDYSSRYSTAISGSKTELVAVVPEGALSGQIRVEDTDPLRDTPFHRVSIPPMPSNSLDFVSRLRAGDVGKILRSYPFFTYEITTQEEDEELLLIIFNAAPPPTDSWQYWYQLTLDYGQQLESAGAAGGAEAAAGEVSPPTVDGRRPAVYGSKSRDFRRRLRKEVTEILERANPAVGSVAPGDVRPDPLWPGIVSGAEVQQTRQFTVLADPNGNVNDPSSYATVTADLRYEGNRTLLYVDQETSQGNMSDADAAELGQTFDEQIYHNNRTHFGYESDINGDGKVAILLTPAINRLSQSYGGDGIIVGYFFPIDLLPQYVNPQITNGMEIFYSIVPDMNGDFGPVIEKDWALEVIREVLAHEFQHMIMFNYRILIYGTASLNLSKYQEELWIDEGLSHIAENLNGYHQGNIDRANLFLIDPGSAHLTFLEEDNLDRRGAAFLFLRLLGDLYGNGVYKNIVQSMTVGTATIEHATGEQFIELFANWAASCYLSGLGVSSDSRYNYSSIDLPTDFKPVAVIDIPQWTEYNGNIESLSPEYIVIRVPAGSTAVLNFLSDWTGRLNAILIRRS